MLSSKCPTDVQNLANKAVFKSIHKSLHLLKLMMFYLCKRKNITLVDVRVKFEACRSFSGKIFHENTIIKQTEHFSRFQFIAFLIQYLNSKAFLHYC